MIIITLVVFLLGFNVLVSNCMAGDSQWLVYVGILLSTNFLLASYAFKKTSMYEFKTKCTCLILQFVFAWMLFDFYLSAYFADSIISDRVSNLLGFIQILLLMVAYGFFSKVQQFKDDYAEEECFLVYKQPIGIVNYLISFYKYPFYSCSIVVRGTEYKFLSSERYLIKSEKGKIVKSEYVPQRNHVYKRLRSIKDEDVVELINKKWKVKNNCFRIFEGFEDYEK